MRDAVSIRVDGLLKFKRLLKVFNNNKGKEFSTGVLKASHHLKKKSQEIVPVDTGKLKASAKASTDGNGWGTIGLVSYNTDYAIFVHEDLVARHARGTMAKFLEIPARREREAIKKIIEKEVKDG